MRFQEYGPKHILIKTNLPVSEYAYHLMNGKFCGEAWDAVSCYVYAALQGGSIIMII